jgi:hypothetical protein
LGRFVVGADNADPEDLEADDCAASAFTLDKIDCKSGVVTDDGFRVGVAEDKAG